MEDFFNSFIDVKELKTNKKNIEKITKEVNDKMNGFIEDEKFEDVLNLELYIKKKKKNKIN
jgi:hypothetical protein